MTHELYVTIENPFRDDVDQEKINDLFRVRHSLRHDRSNSHGISWDIWDEEDCHCLVIPCHWSFIHMQYTAEDIMYVLTEGEIYEFTLRFSF